MSMRIEHWWFTLPLRLRSLLRRTGVEQELDEELQYHLDRKIDEGTAQGLSPKEARHRALRAMDGLTQRKEEIRDTRRIHWLTNFLDDVRYAVRSLRRTPGFTALVAVTLALGIGFTSTSFSGVDALIFRPYPVPHPGAVVTLVSTTRDSNYDNFSYREYLDIRAHTRSFDGVIANAAIGTVAFTADPAASPRPRAGMMVSGNYFRVLGVEPRLGRGFRDDEDQTPARDAVVVLATDFWKNEFAADPAIVGRTVRLNGRNFTVVGVLPESFPGMGVFANPDFYMPLAMAPVFSTNPRKHFFEDRDDRELSVKARLLPYVTQRQAQNELTLLAKSFERDYPELNRNRSAAVRTHFEMLTRTDTDASPWKFMLITGILALAVLLVACTNVAGLLLSRARSRTREIAVRLAMGAGRFRLIRLLLTESLLFAFLGGIGGLAVAYANLSFVASFSLPSELPSKPPFHMDARVMLACLALSVLSAVICGLAPAIQTIGTDLVNGLKAADVDIPGRKRLWGRNVLVVAQVATSLMLLMAAFLMVRGFDRSLAEGTPFLKDRLLLVRFDPRLAQYNEAQTQRFYRSLTERVRQTPGVLGAALTQNPPLALEKFDALTFVPDGFEMPRDRENFTSTMDTVDEGYFETMGVPIVRGRGFLASDTADAPRVAVVNQQFAKHYWPGTDAVGKRIRLEKRGGAAVEVVGVAETIKYRSASEKPLDFVYLPLAQHPVPRMLLLTRTSGDPLQWVQPVKEVVRALDPNLPMLQTKSYDELYRYNVVDGPGAATKLIGTMGIVGLLMAIAGLYGLVAYNVSRRTREIGIRMALGAAPSDVLRLVMSKGLKLVGIGTAVGLAMGVGVERLLKSALFNTGGVDLLVYVVVVPSMVVVTVLAAYLPARKAARIAPTQALRYE
jgi:macrolide transport system ATP-binding/permease protein